VAGGSHARCLGGTYFFLRDGHSGQVWSAAYQPSGVEPDTYEVAFSEDHVEIRRRDGAIGTMLEIPIVNGCTRW
jgi:cyclic beta-1,2-glucan synthetase